MSFYQTPNAISRAVRTGTLTVRVATLGDSTADTNSTITDQTVVSTTYAAPVQISNVSPEVYQLQLYCPYVYVVANGGIGGETTTNVLARDSAAYTAGRKAIADIRNTAPDVIHIRIGINNLTGVNPATAAAAVATCVAESQQILQRAMTPGVVPIFEGIAGYSGPSVFADTVRESLRAVNLQMQAYCGQFPSRVYYLDPVGVTCDQAGNFLPGVVRADGLGVHISVYGTARKARALALIYNALFGAFDGTRYTGTNLLKNAAIAAVPMPDNSLFARTVAPGFGTTPLGFTPSASNNASRANAAIIPLTCPDGATRNFAKFQATNNVANGFIQWYFGLDAAQFQGVIGQKIGIEVMWYVAGATDAIAPPEIRSCLVQFNSTSGNTIQSVANQNSQRFTVPETGKFFQKTVFQPFQFPVDTAVQTTNEIYLNVRTDELVTWELGIANPLLVTVP